MFGISSHYRFEEHILPCEGIEKLVIRKASGNDGVRITRHAFITEDAIKRKSTTLQRFLHGIIIFYRLQVLVNHKGDATLRLFKDAVAVLCHGHTGNECKCNNGNRFLHRSVGFIYRCYLLNRDRQIATGGLPHPHSHVFQV